jgi:radical SAM superfamily enzyme YgiQ (UPF0313 family)
VGIPTLGALLKQSGHHCDIFFQALPGFDESKLRGYDLVGLGSLSGAINEAYRLGDMLKAAGVPVVMGGPHASFMPEEALEHCDYVVVGEGEQSFPALVNALAREESWLNVPGLAFRKDGQVEFTAPTEPVDFESLPAPDFTLSPQVSPDRLPPIIVTSRGCPHHCMFCSVTSMFGRRYRFRANQQVLAELRLVQNRSVCFGDDNFCANPKRTKSLLREMITRRAAPLRWSGQICVESGSDEELLDLMEDTRCRIVFVGIESLNPETLKSFRKVHNADAVMRCVENLHRRHIGIHGMFVVGPEDTPETVSAIVDYAIATGLDTIQIMSLTPFPGTAAWTDLEPRLLHREWKWFDGMHVVVQPSKCTAYDLQVALLRAMEKFYSLKQVLTAYRPGRGWRFTYRLSAGYIIRRWRRLNREYIEKLRIGKSGGLPVNSGDLTGFSAPR